MISLTTSDLFGFAALVVGFLGVLTAVMALYIWKRASSYDEDKRRVELEMMRRSVESQMYSLNEKLVATESRWRDVNHLLLSSQARQPDVSETAPIVELSPFLKAAGVTRDDTARDEKLVFVLTPFHPEYKKQFEVISLVCQNLGLTAMRGDEEYVSDDVFPHIVQLIVRSRLIIANIDGRNPNVLYELGIAHGLGKQTILISSTPEDVPFDVRAKRLVLFNSLDELRERLRDEVARALTRIDQS